MTVPDIRTMLDKIADAGGSIIIENGQPKARNVPAHFLPFLKLHRDEIIKTLTEPRKIAQVERSCKMCRYGNREYQNACKEPVRAGLAEWYGIRWHPNGGRDCGAFDTE